MQRRVYTLLRLSSTLARQQLAQAAARDAALLQPGVASRFALGSALHAQRAWHGAAWRPMLPLSVKSAAAAAAAAAVRRAPLSSLASVPSAGSAAAAAAAAAAVSAGRQHWAAVQRQKLVAAAQRWRLLQERVVALVNGCTQTSAGQVLAAALLPFTLLLTLYPNRHVSYAYSIHQHQQQQQQAAFRPQLLSKQQQQCSPVMRALHRLSEEAAVLFRGVFLVALFTPLCLTAPLVFYWGVARAQWMQLLRWTLEQAGPAFIKWGQWGSSRPDLFPPDVCTTLESLQSNAPAHSSAYSRSAVEAAFGRPLDQLFCWFEDAPLASGSIAQIHRARLAPAAAAECGVAPGTLVAVKIRHPGVGYIMSRDFVLMERAAALSKQMDGLKHLRLDESVRQFGAPLQEQLDLSQEAEHLRKFQHNFRRWRNVSFPTPIYPLVRPDVLVESFEPGSQINGYVTVAGPRKADSTLMGAIAETGLNVYLQMLLKDNFIHADMHPGNILVREVERDSSWVNQAVAALAAQVEWRLGGLLGPLLGVGKVLGVAGSSESLAAPQPQLVLLDTGMIAQLSQTDQSSVVNFFRALTKQDGEQIARTILAMSERHTCPDPEQFVTSMKAMFEGLDPEYIRVYTSQVLGDMIEQLRRHQVTLKSTISTVVVTTLVLEGWSSRLNPDLHIMDTLRELLANSWNERLSRAVDNIMSHGSLAVA